MNSQLNKKLLVLPGLILLGLVLAVWQPVEMATVLDWGRRLSSRPELMALVVLVMALMFTFALPGSTFLWLIAPFQPPWIATALLVLGSVGGAVGAHIMAGRLGKGWQPTPAAAKVFDLLSSRSDLLTQCALRILPGFPHSVVNYAGGVLKLPLPGFVLAATLGLTIKWAIYSSAVYGAVEAAEQGEAVNAMTLAPLFLLTVLLLIGAWFKRKVESRQA